jgi:hypothetical protein
VCICVFVRTFVCAFERERKRGKEQKEGGERGDSGEETEKEIDLREERREREKRETWMVRSQGTSTYLLQGTSTILRGGGVGRRNSEGVGGWVGE